MEQEVSWGFQKSDAVYKQEKLESLAECTILTGGIFTILLS